VLEARYAINRVDAIKRNPGIRTFGSQIKPSESGGDCCVWLNVVDVITLIRQLNFRTSHDIAFDGPNQL
jgi:hypothetical protein